MSKFSGPSHRTAPPTGPVSATLATRTHEGGTGFESDAKSELWMLAVTNLVGETTFYESAGDRDKRFVDLVHEVTREDPEWVRGLVPWLRNGANMRSAPVVIACEYVKAGGPHGRSVVDSACSRADEPAEVLGYWLATHGRKIPQPVKRGIADASVRLYTEKSALKYDGGARGIRMGDVIELVHPTPKAPWQSALFKHLIDKRHNRPDAHSALAGYEIDQTVWPRLDGTEEGAGARLVLPTLARAYALDNVPQDERRGVLRERGPEALTAAGFTWERLSGWIPGGMDAEAWECIIPSMGVMSLLRNLRNFEQAGVSKPVLNQVSMKLSDPDEIAGSRQFPYRFWSAYKNSGTIRFGAALEDALELSVRNIPEFPGRTLVMVDTSGSMNAPVSSNSKVMRLEVAAMFAAAVAARSNGRVDLCPYADSTCKAEIQTSVLRTIQDIVAQVGRVGAGTQTWQSAIEQFDGHDRIVVFTDMQDHPTLAEQGNAHGYYLDQRGMYTGFGNTRYSHGRLPAVKLPDVPIYVWDLAGYGKSNVDTSVRGRYLFSGFTDTAFRLVNLLEAGRDTAWPWEQG